MFRNSYDYDVTIWSPQGRLFQVEYAIEAVKFGSAIVGLKNTTDAVLVSLKKASSDLAAFKKKIIEIDEYLGVTYSGLTADAKLLTRFLRNECLSYRYTENVCIPAERLLEKLSRKMHVATQRYDQRPFGVGMLVAGFDSKGPHIYEACPSGTFFNCKAMTLGGRCQSARTYLEKNFSSFPDCNLEEIIKHGLRALQSTLPKNLNLTNQNVSIGVVGADCEFKIFSDEEVYNHLLLIEGENHRPDCDEFDEEDDNNEVS
ncbi:hypothetical protein RN001_014359 [Aquatica leii]|uniref:Proteasome subunit alpha type n=1 Tax=Aquatica leii TaxID=1421715 RepID=A0AAN7PYG4_9COLE|nr:hypothetical protein RN001_014359 [Aquatica leii]